ncbi:MAG: TIGR04100 family radical SAM protein [Oscillospiraceae bacterium]|jgi:radical SAM enzyme (TIGR04100 family)
MMTITYKVKNGVYVNMTNRCPCACTFCIRQNGPGAYGSDSLWLEREPSIKETVDSIFSWDLDKYDELVFCGYGEPTERLPDLLITAAEVKKKSSIPIRVNTNGLSDLIWGRPTACDMAGLVDTVSISLNSVTPEKYLEITKSKFGMRSFEAVKKFAKDAKIFVPNVVMTVVDVIPKEDIEEAGRICSDLGVTLRVRKYEGPEGDGGKV